MLARAGGVNPAACNGTWHSGGTCVICPTVGRGMLEPPQAGIEHSSHGIASLLRPGFETYSRPCLGSNQLRTSHVTAAVIATSIKPQNVQSISYIFAVIQQPMSVKGRPSIVVCQLWRHLWRQPSGLCKFHISHRSHFWFWPRPTTKVFKLDYTEPADEGKGGCGYAYANDGPNLAMI